MITEGTKKIIKWLGILMVIGICAIFLYRLGVNIYQKLYPPPPPKPDLTFGKLPPITFPQNATNAHFSYTINTIDGTLPTFPLLISVYPLQQYTPTLTSLQNIEMIINHTEFAGNNPQSLSDTIYSWSETNSPFKNIIIDIVNLDFTLTSQYFGDQDVLSARNLPDESGASAIAKGFFQSLQSYPTDIDETKTKTTLLAISNNTLIPATSLSTAQIIRVDFYQNARNNINIVYPHYPDSTISALVASGSNGPEVIEAHYAGKTVIDAQGATYPIITAQEALQKLQDGQAYIANYAGQASGTQVPESITDVSLGYYLSADKKQPYMQPVIVFTGNNGFVAYVSAVQDAYLGS